MRELFESLNKNHGVRFTAAQKENFAAFIQEFALQHGLKFIEQRTKGGINLIMGDIGHCSVVVTAHYDTSNCCRRAFVSGVSNRFFTRLKYSVSGTFSAMTARRRANPKNFNDNTSGVCCLLSLLAEVKSGAAFVLFDNEESNFLGSRQFYRRYRQQLKSKLIINLDCIGCGDYAGVLHYNNFSGRYASDIVGFFEDSRVFNLRVGGYFATDAAVFEKAVNISCFFKRKNGYEYDNIHTAKDDEIDFDNLLRVKNAVKVYIAALDKKQGVKKWKR